MAKGTVAKTEIFAKLKEIYPNAFMDDKVLRIPFFEDGDVVEIKVALTAAKDVLGSGAANAPAPAAKKEINFEDNDEVPFATAKDTQPTKEETENIERLLKALNF